MSVAEVVAAVRAGARTVPQIAAQLHVPQWSAELRAALDRAVTSMAIVAAGGGRFDVPGVVIEPGNHTAITDSGGYIWVRVDEQPGVNGDPWHALFDVPGEPEGLCWTGFTVHWGWLQSRGHTPTADPERARRALARVRREVAS